MIISPPGDAAPFADPTKHLLAATSTNTLKDQDPATAGAQFTVVACSNTTGMATLKVGSAGGALTPLGAAVATAGAVLADNCPAGFNQVATFTSVTLPESMLNADGTLKAATGLEVDVQAGVSGTIDASPEADLWVASVAPTVTASTTAPICNTDVQSSITVTKDVTFNASIGSVVLTATPLSGTAMTYSTPMFTAGAVTFAGVTFVPGETDLTAVVTDLAGNTSTLAQPCAVTVGTAPIVTFTAPAAGKSLCAFGTTATTCIADSDGLTAGWQGTLTVSVTAGGVAATSGTVTFTAAAGSAAATTLGTVNIVNGVATLGPTSISDGNPVTITATTSSLGANGVGTGTRTVIVASTKPAAPTNVQVVVKDRRQTSFTVSWTAPAGAAGYELRYGPGPLDASVFAMGTLVPVTGTPLAAGMTENHDATSLYIESNYWFAVAAKDAAGNLSAVVSAAPSPVPPSCTTPPCPIRALFNQTIIDGPQATPANYAGFGYYVDGSGNFVGDANADILAGDGYGNSAYLFAGSSTFAGGAPAVTFQGSTPGNFFGSNVANIGDVDGDGLEDIGISSAYESPPVIYIFKGRTTPWPAIVADTAADYKITIDAPFGYGSLLGYPIVKVGDINGDGVGDFACGGIGLSPGGGVLVVFGATPFGANPVLSTLVTGGRAAILTDATAGGVFGAGIVALGAMNGTLVVSAPGDATNMGVLRAYRWNGTAFATTGSAYTGATANGQIGGVLSVLGALGVISGNSGLPSGGTVLTFLDGTLAAPFSGTPQTFTDSLGADTFGTLALGGGFSGSNSSLSFIGDATPDLVVGGAVEGNHQTTVYILDGNDLGTLTSPIDAPASAKSQVALPSDWKRTTAYSSATNINGDLYGDIVLGETDNTNFSPPFRGRVLVLW